MELEITRGRQQVNITIWLDADRGAVCLVCGLEDGVWQTLARCWGKNNRGFFKGLSWFRKVWSRSCQVKRVRVKTQLRPPLHYMYPVAFSGIIHFAQPKKFSCREEAVIHTQLLYRIMCIITLTLATDVWIILCIYEISNLTFGRWKCSVNKPGRVESFVPLLQLTLSFQNALGGFLCFLNLWAVLQWELSQDRGSSCMNQRS